MTTVVMSHTRATMCATIPEAYQAVIHQAPPANAPSEVMRADSIHTPPQW